MLMNYNENNKHIRRNQLKRIAKYILLITIMLLTLAGCKSDNKDHDPNGQYGNSDYISNDNEDTVPNRKIIYEVSADITTKDITTTINNIKKELNSDEWLDKEYIYDDHASLVLRVKSDRLDEFLDNIFDNYKISNFRKTATDVSLEYQNKSEIILTYEKERDRLLELYEHASFYEVLEITKRLSEIEIKIQKLKGELKIFDSLVDYSEVTLDIYLKEKATKPTDNFGQKLLYGLNSGFTSFVAFLSTLAIIIVTLLPWMIIIIPVSYLIYRYIKKNNKK